MTIDAEIERIVTFIKKIIQDSKAEGIILGLSGGIDSALVGTLCVRALGKSRVSALLLPIHSPETDLDDAKLMANHLGITYEIVDLTQTFDLLLGALSPAQEPKELAKANLKPRLRMIALYYQANKLNYLVAGTGNRSEKEIGYFTKYGDGAADFLPILHLYKRQVREMARYLKVPNKIIERKPSAGLWAGQTTEGEVSQQLGFPIIYDQLDEMLDHIATKTFDRTDAHYQSLLKLREKNKHKSQLPPSLPV
ncbi:MAG: NAD+ synthase [Candidatus Helarchaeota archaeon]|nr:NAD+ synthase [Candidatus Helarchaeota archaeon]